MEHLQGAHMQHHGVTGALQLPALQASPLLCGEAEGQRLRRVPEAVTAPCDTTLSCASSEWGCWFGSGVVTEKELFFSGLFFFPIQRTSHLSYVQIPFYQVVAVLSPFFILSPYKHLCCSQ